MNPTHRDRQDTYRFWHPQLNMTFRSRLEYLEVHRALHETGQTPRQILVQWAWQVIPHFESDSTPKQPNPEEPSPDFPEDFASTIVANDFPGQIQVALITPVIKGREWKLSLPSTMKHMNGVGPSRRITKGPRLDPLSSSARVC